LREATGKAVRNLGDEGKKKGLTTTLPVALGELQASGDIRRVPVNGRFDQQRYQYALWRPNPLRNFKLSPEEVQTELGRKFFTWIGLASAADFQRFSGLGVKAAKAALESLKLESIEITSGDHRFLLPEDRSKFDAFKPPKEPRYSLLGSIDSLFQLPTPLEDAFEGHAIVDRGKLVGIWEYDLPTESIAWVPYVKKDKALQEAVTRTEEFVQRELGDARSFSLDSPKSRAPRIAALRKAAANA
jgi:Winged helix DNA-binding domain